MNSKKRSTSWKAGQSGNPNGRPKLSREEKEIRSAAHVELLAAFKELIGKTAQEVEELSLRTDESWLKTGLARAASYTAKTGDFEKLNKVLDRVIGKPNYESPSSTIELNSEVLKSIIKDMQAGKSVTYKSLLQFLFKAYTQVEINQDTISQINTILSQFRMTLEGIKDMPLDGIADIYYATPK